MSTWVSKREANRAQPPQRDTKPEGLIWSLKLKAGGVELVLFAAGGPLVFQQTIEGNVETLA